MKPLLVELLDDAVDEAQHQYRWYLERSRRTATGFIEELDAAIRAIGDAPERWPKYLHGTRRYVFNRYPYSLVYRVDVDLVLVVAVAPARKRPGYWSKRLR